MGFLALIGLGLILWMLSRGVRKVGSFMDRLSNSMLLAETKLVRAQTKEIDPTTIKKIQRLRKTDSYLKKVRNEIDELTK